ncbi:MAG: type II methionyl aminopeptidase [Candidatus Altiarchaeota archaeon]|nr:type II methionyl aminopeptidase [Candidatus Altiarchaeota archaeon]
MDMQANVEAAGKVSSKIRLKLPKLIRPDATYYSIVEFVEVELAKAGIKPAFPVNVSVNAVAAHFGPTKTDKDVFKTGDIIKVDFGAHLDGWPVDSSSTFDLGDNEALVLAAKEALESALTIITSRGPEATLSEIGKVIETSIKNRGFVPISNLTGHSMEQWELHSGLSIHNYDSGSDKAIGEGLFAVEPFATTGAGQVREGAPSSIYKLVRPQPQRLPQLRHLMKEIQAFGTLPFSGGWVSEPRYLSMLVKQGVLHNYPQLVEVQSGLVSQFEHTVLVNEGKVKVVTL